MWLIDFMISVDCDRIADLTLYSIYTTFITWANSEDTHRPGKNMLSDQGLHCLLLDSLCYFRIEADTLDRHQMSLMFWLIKINTLATCIDEVFRLFL